MLNPAVSTAFLAVLVFAIGCQERTASEFIADAKRYHAKGDRNAAIIQLKNAIQKDAKNPEARYLLGTVYIETGDLKSAEKELQRARELGQDPAEVVPQLSRVLLMKGDFKAALAEIDAVPAGAHSAQLLSLRGQAQLGLGRKEHAKSSFEDALSLHPDLAEALLGKAKLALADRDFDKAIALADRVLENSPEKSEVWLFKGDVERLRGRDDAAVAAYEALIKANPEHLNARLSLASVQLHLNRYDKAKEQIELVRKAAPANPMANYLLALAEFQQKNFAGARDLLLQVLRTVPDHPQTVLLLGAVELALNSNAQAEQHLNWVVQRAPDHLYARRLLAVSLLRSGNAERAIEVLGPGLKQAPQDSSLISLAAEAHMHKGDYARATQYLEQAVALEPKSAQMRTALATSRLAAGQSEAGIQDLESAVELDSGKHQADVLLALSRLNQKNYDKALEVLQGLERKQPNNPLTHNLQAAAYIGKQDYDRARKQLEHALALNPSYFPATANLAQLDLRAQRPADAKQRFLTVLDHDKNHLQAMLALANLGLATGAPKEEVIGWLDRAKKAHPQSVQPHIAFARYYLKLGEAQRALLAAQDARNLSPDNADALETLGFAQSAAGEKEHAISTYTRLAVLQPRSAQAQFQLAQAQEAAGHRGAAVQALKKALELKPDYLEAQVALIGLQLNAGNKNEALALTQKMQKQSPKSPAGYVLEGDVLMAEKKYASAATAYTRAYELGKTANLVIKIHGAQTLAGRPTQGEAILAQWLKANPNDLAARLYAAEVRLKAGQYKQAIEYYRSVLDKQPDHLIALNNLAWAYHHLKQPQALGYAERAYKLKPESSAIADTLGWVLVEQGNTARGLELLNKAVSLNPNNAETRYHLAVALARSGDKSKARQELESLLTPGKEFPQREEAQALLKQL